VKNQRSGTVSRGGGQGRRNARDARRHHRCLTAKLQDRKDGADDQERVDQGLNALFFLRAHEKGVGGFECFRVSGDCFHGFCL
jgi:hypothetical protein